MSNPNLIPTQGTPEAVALIMEAIKTKQPEALSSALEKFGLTLSGLKNVIHHTEYRTDPAFLDKYVRPEVLNQFDIYSANFEIRDTDSKIFEVPFMIVTAARGSKSNMLLYPMSKAEIIAMANMNLNSEAPTALTIADLTKSHLSASLPSQDEIAQLSKLYQDNNLRKQITAHPMGMGFINSIIGLLQRIPGMKDIGVIIKKKAVITTNMDNAIGVELPKLIKDWVNEKKQTKSEL